MKVILLRKGDHHSFKLSENPFLAQLRSRSRSLAAGKAPTLVERTRPTVLWRSGGKRLGNIPLKKLLDLLSQMLVNKRSRTRLHDPSSPSSHQRCRLIGLGPVRLPVHIDTRHLYMIAITLTLPLVQLLFRRVARTRRRRYLC